MCVKIYICLLLVALGITAFAQGDEDLPRCDWPTGVCVYYNDTCPPDIPHDCHRDYNCPLATNKCCCRGAPPPPEPTERCDYPHGVCTFVGDGCPPDIPIDCRNKYYCPLATNKCCCRNQ
ncbi:small cysteine-rich protein 5-like [Oculina patagonica]